MSIVLRLRNPKWEAYYAFILQSILPKYINLNIKKDVGDQFL